MKTFEVLTHIAGARCVIYQSSEAYIEDHKDVRGDFSHIEVVRRGQIVHRETATNYDAPRRMIALAKEYL